MASSTVLDIMQANEQSKHVKVETVNKYRELAERICQTRVMEIRALLGTAHDAAEPPIEILEKIRAIIERC